MRLRLGSVALTRCRFVIRVVFQNRLDALALFERHGDNDQGAIDVDNKIPRDLPPVDVAKGLGIPKMELVAINNTVFAKFDRGRLAFRPELQSHLREPHLHHDPAVEENHEKTCRDAVNTLLCGRRYHSIAMNN